MSSFSLSLAAVMVQPDLEIVSWVGFIEIVENYSLFTVVAVPPDILGF